MKNISMLLDRLIDIRDKYHAGEVEVSPKHIPLMILLKELEYCERNENLVTGRMKELQKEIDDCKKGLERSREIRLNILTSAESEIKRLGVGYVSNWVQEKVKE